MRKLKLIGVKLVSVCKAAPWTLTLWGRAVRRHPEAPGMPVLPHLDQVQVKGTRAAFLEAGVCKVEGGR